MFHSAIGVASHDVSKCVPENICRALKFFADEVRSVESSVLAAFLATTATIMSGQARLKMGPSASIHHGVTPAIFLLNIGEPGASKSAALTVYCKNILNGIQAMTSKDIKITSRPANFPGICAAIVDLLSS